MAVLATDDFNRADVGNLGANWTALTGEGGFQIVSNTAQPISLALNSGQVYTGISWPDDQYAQAKISASGTNAQTGAGVGVRMSTSARIFYGAVVNKAGSNNVEVFAMTAGPTYTQLAQRTTTWVDGDVMKVEVIGTTLRVYQNGVQLGADITSALIASGNAGLKYHNNATGIICDDFEGGSIATNTNITPATMIKGT